MGIPDFQTLMRPALAQLADGDVHTTREVREALADAYQLNEADRAHLLPSGRARTFDNRVSWALTYLAQAGLTDRPRRGHVRITDVGPAGAGRRRLGWPAIAVAMGRPGSGDVDRVHPVQRQVATARGVPLDLCARPVNADAA